jgi:hypothetical protein
MKGVVKTVGGVEELIETKVVRGKPGETVTIAYEVYPDSDPVAIADRANFNYGLNGNDNASDNYIVVKTDGTDAIDRINQRIRLKLDNCGYSVIGFESLNNKPADIYMEIPVFVYYDRIDLLWTGSEYSKSHGKTFKSRLEDVRNVVYIADGETLRLDYEPYVNGLKKDKGTAKIVIKLATISTSSTSGNVVAGISYDSSEKTSYIRISNNNTSNITSATNSDNLLKVEYIGTLAITYEYYNGSETPTEFTKTLMVYSETWARKQIN